MDNYQCYTNIKIMNEILVKQQIYLMLEEIRANMIQEAKDKKLAWANSEKSISGIFDSHLYLYGNQFISEIINRFGLNQEQAIILFGKAKADIYDKYSK